MNQQYFAEGSTVYDVNGNKVGMLASYDPRGGYLTAQKGVFFPHDIYIPVSDVSGSHADSVFLNLSKDDLNDERYKTPPALSAGSATTQAAILDEDVGGVTNRRTGTRDRDMAHASTEEIQEAGQPAASRHMESTPAAAETGNANDITVPVREEELGAQKQQVERGRVHVHKEVLEQPTSITVPVTHEEVRVERVPVDGATAAGAVGPDAFQERNVDVPLMGERVKLEKQARVGEEIHLHKRQVTEQERVSDTVRKERVNVEGLDEQGNLLPEQGNNLPNNVP